MISIETGAVPPVRAWLWGPDTVRAVLRRARCRQTRSGFWTLSLVRRDEWFPLGSECIRWWDRPALTGNFLWIVLCIRDWLIIILKQVNFEYCLNRTYQELSKVAFLSRWANANIVWELLHDTPRPLAMRCARFLAANLENKIKQKKMKQHTLPDNFLMS